MKRLLLLFLTAGISQAAITEYYVNNAGSGAADGTSEANAMSFVTFQDWMVTGGSFTAAAGDRFNVKVDGTYSRTTTVDTWVNGGTATSPVIVRGYSTVVTDGYLGRTNGNGVLITTDMPTITYTTGRINSTGLFVIECLNVTSAASAPTITLASGNVLRACNVVNSSTNAAAAAISFGTASACVAYNCDVLLTGGSGGNAAIIAQGGSQFIHGCRLIGSDSAFGILMRSTAKVSRTVISHFATGISVDNTSATNTIDANTITQCTGDGIDVITGLTGMVHVVNNMIVDNGGYGIDLNNAASTVFLAGNRTRDNAGATNLGTDWVAATNFGSVITDTGGAETDFVNAGAADFSLISASPATSAGIPLYMSIGALQRSQTGAASTAYSATFAQ